MSRRGNSEGTVRKRPDGRWEARFSVNGKQHSVYGKTREETVRKMRAKQRTVDQGIPLSNERITVRDYLNQWLEVSVKPSVRPATYDSYASHAKHHLVPALGKIPLAKLQPQHVQQMMNQLLEAGLSATTVLRIRATLRRALNQAVKWDLIARNAATLVNPPKAEKYRVDPITPEEAVAILDAVAEHRLAALYTLLLAIGLRLGEGLGLAWRDVDLELGSASVRHSLQKIDGEFQLVAPKSESSRRTLPLPVFVVDTLKRHQESQEGERLLAGDKWHDHGLVFTTDLGKPLDNANVYKTFRRRLDAAGIRPLRLHDLRHGCASLLLAKGVSPRVVMETLGHSQISLTMNTYAHVIPALQRDAAERMDEVFSGNRKPTL